MFTCSECKREFGYKKNLYCHLRRIHGHENPAPRKRKGTVLCEFCSKTFLTSSTLRRHKKTIHNHVDTVPIIHSRIKCTECSWSEARTYRMLRKHLLKSHDKEVPVEELQFGSFHEFETWKTSYESKNVVSYVMDSAPKKLANNIVKRYYSCHRSHTYKSKGQNLRSIKNMGSHKIGAGCPSTMELTINDSGALFVKLWPVHLGHSAEIGRSNLTKTERATIAAKLSEGVPLERVIEDVRTSVTQGDEIRRIHLLEKKDLYNIKRDFSINYASKLPKNDAISVDLWVNAMEATESSPILYYKKRGFPEEGFLDNDLILIFMTEFQQGQLLTHGVDKICVVGTQGQCSSYNFQLFAVVVLDSFGAVVPTAFCVSNRGDAKLFSLFFKSLRNQIGRMTTITFLSEDAAFYDAWVSVMGPAKNQLLCTQHNQGNWFQNLNKIKYTYLEPRKCRRLDKTINALLDLIRDVQFEMLIRISEEELAPKLTRIRESHKKSLEIDDASIEPLEGNKWALTARTDCVVEKITEFCSSNCNLKCSACNVCVHMFKCSCIDNIIRVNICKHIHKIARGIGSADRILDAAKPIHPEALASEENKFSDEIRHKCDLLLGLSARIELNPDSKRVLFEYLDKAIDVLNDGNAAEENVQKQPIFCSIKIKEEFSASVVDDDETSNMQDLFSGSTDVIHVQTGVDHTYYK